MENYLEKFVDWAKLKLISSKRLLRKIRTFPKEDFEKVRTEIKNFL